jgi:hypothetical protein
MRSLHRSGAAAAESRGIRHDDYLGDTHPIVPFGMGRVHLDESGVPPIRGRGRKTRWRNGVCARCALFPADDVSQTIALVFVIIVVIVVELLDRFGLVELDKGCHGQPWTLPDPSGDVPIVSFASDPRGLPDAVIDSSMGAGLDGVHSISG